MRLHHIGIVVADINCNSAVWQRCRLQPLTPVIHDHAQQVKVQFWGNSAGPQVELIEPAGPNSPAMASLEKGGGLNHLCYEVENLDEIYSTAREKGSIQVCAPVPAKAFDGRRICFLFDTMLGLIEFVEAA